MPFVSSLRSTFGPQSENRGVSVGSQISEAVRQGATTGLPTGGTIVLANGYRHHIFSSAGNNTFSTTTLSPQTIEAHAWGGGGCSGGGGGWDTWSSAGAGGYGSGNVSAPASTSWNAYVGGRGRNSNVSTDGTGGAGSGWGNGGGGGLSGLFTTAGTMNQGTALVVSGGGGGGGTSRTGGNGTAGVCLGGGGGGSNGQDGTSWDSNYRGRAGTTGGAGGSSSGGGQAGSGMNGGGSSPHGAGGGGGYWGGGGGGYNEPNDMGGGGGGSGFGAGSVTNQVFTQSNRHVVANTGSAIYTLVTAQIGGNRAGVNNGGRANEGVDGVVVVRYLA